MRRKGFGLSLLLLFLACLPSWAVTEVHRNGGTWFVPAGVTEITVESWGGGGAGGVSNSGEGGGGGGAYARSTLSVTPGDRYIIHIGNGGGAPNAQGGGLPSGFQIWPEGQPQGAWLNRSEGGVNGQGRQGGAGGQVQFQGSIGDVIYAGGSGGTSSGGNAGGGGGGSSAGSTGPGNDGQPNSGSTGGAGGAAPTGGAAGAPGGNSGENGTPGYRSPEEYDTYFSAGGGGGGAHATAGGGAVGKVVITY